MELEYKQLPSYSVPNPSQQTFNLRLFRCCNRQQRGAGTASVVAVEVTGVFQAADAQLADDATAWAGDALLLLFRDFQLVVLPGKIDLLAGLGCKGGKAQDGSGGSGLKGFEQDRSRTREHLEAYLPGTRLDRSSRRRNSKCLATCQIAGGDECAACLNFGIHHARRNRFKNWSDSHRAPGRALRGGDRGAYALYAAAGVLDSDDIRVLRQLGHKLNGNIVG